MRIAFSNLAWDVAHDEAVAELLKSHAVDAIDVAPGKYFPDPKVAQSAEMDRVAGWWGARGIAITGMQSLLFGTSGLNMFGDAGTQAAMLAHLDAVCRVGAGVGAARLVFGSPRNRDRCGLSDEQTHEMALSFFRRLGDLALGHGVVICLEPNPPCYGSNFLLNSAETAQMVRDAAHPAIRMQLDTGAMAINGEDAGAVVGESAPLIGHVHASEPGLVPLGEGETPHDRAAAALMQHRPDLTVSIEMLPPKDVPLLEGLERALLVATRHYRSTRGGAGSLAGREGA